jgi:hypothetical protein
MDGGLHQMKGGLAIARYDSRDGHGRHVREDRYIAEAIRNRAPRGYSPCIRPYPPDLACLDVDDPIGGTGSDPDELGSDEDREACASS